MTAIHLKADPARGGDLGNYWHYLFGFFIPFSYLLWKRPELFEGKKLILDSCNPLTDALAKEYLNHLGVEHEFEELTEKTIGMTRKEWKSIRRKIWRRLSYAERKFRGDNASWFTYHHFKFKKNLIIIPRWDKYLEEFGNFPPSFKKELNSYRKFIIFKVLGLKPIPLENKSWLIIKRAAPPEIISSEAGKKARWFPGYGSERRELRGIEEGVKELESVGYLVKARSTGDLGLLQQITEFYSSKVLVGVRGAEFANMIWMDPESKVYLWMSSSFQNEPIQRKLASACQIRYHEIPHEGQVSPVMDVAKLLEINSST